MALAGDRYMAPPALAARFHDAPPCLHGMNSQFGRVAASRILPLAGPGVGDDKIAPIRLEEVRWGVAFDWLRSSAQIHLAALHLRPLPAGIDPLGFDAGCLHQRCE